MAAQPVLPNGNGDIAPERPAVQIDIHRGAAKRRQGVAHRVAFPLREGPSHDGALAWHDGIARSEVPPPGFDREIVTRHVAAVGRGGHRDLGHLRS